MTKAPKKRGRPPKEASAMLSPVTLRLPKPMMDEIDAIVEARSLEGVDKATVIRELIAKGLRK